MIRYLCYIILILCGLKYIKPNLNNNITVISLVIVLGLYIIDLIIQKNNIENFSNVVEISNNNYYIAIRSATSRRSVGDRIGTKLLYNSISKSIGFIYFYNSTISTIRDIYSTADTIDKYIQIYVPVNYYFLAEYGSTATTNDRYCYQSIKSVLDTSITKIENTVGFRIPTNILYNGTYNKITRLYIFKDILVINYFNTNDSTASGSMLSTTSATMKTTTDITLVQGVASINGGYSDSTYGYIRFHYKNILIETANKNIQSTITDRRGDCLKFTLNTTNIFNFTYLNKTLANYIKDLLTKKNEDTIIYMFIPVGYYLVAKYKDTKNGILCYSSSNSVLAKTTTIGSASTIPYHGEYTEPIILRYQIEDSTLDSIYICKARYCLTFGSNNNFYNSTTLSSTSTTTPSALLSM